MYFYRTINSKTMKQFYFYFLVLIFLQLSTFVKAQDNNSDFVYRNAIYNSDIYTVQLYSEEKKQGLPVLQLNSDKQLTFSFDELNNSIQDYYYRIKHCTVDWKLSNLSEFDYLDGFSENQITDYKNAFNTRVNYNHYKLRIPNNDIQLKLSGNYILEVFNYNNPDSVVIHQRFMAVDSKVQITSKVKQPIKLALRDTHQEIDFSVLHPNFSLNSPQTNITAVVTQNYRFDGSQKILHPIFIRKDELVFSYQDKNVFAGTNEFRHFNIKSTRYLSQYVKDVNTQGDTTLITLSAGNNRHFKPYIYEPDINGKYFIDVQELDNPDTEADYVNVKFTLNTASELHNASVYVFGDFNRYRCNAFNKMHYNFNEKSYTATLLLKQGYYNYGYAVVRNNENIPDLGYYEGNHWQTENIYTIYIYYHDFAKDYDKLIGVSNIKSTKGF